MAALPAVWLVNRDDDASARPNVAAVGLAAGDATPATTSAPVDPMGDVTPRFLDAAGVAPAAPGQVVAVVGTDGGSTVARATAIFRRSVRDTRTCAFSGVPSGSHVTVVNVANDRSIDCWTALRAPDQPQDELVMSAAAFAQIADPTTAPIHVEIRAGS